jgi:hypothetical protein
LASELLRALAQLLQSCAALGCDMAAILACLQPRRIQHIVEDAPETCSHFLK